MDGFRGAVDAMLSRARDDGGGGGDDGAGAGAQRHSPNPGPTGSSATTTTTGDSGDVGVGGGVVERRTSMLSSSEVSTDSATSSLSNASSFFGTTGGEHGNNGPKPPFYLFQQQSSSSGRSSFSSGSLLSFSESLLAPLDDAGAGGRGGGSVHSPTATSPQPLPQMEQQEPHRTTAEQRRHLFASRPREKNNSLFDEALPAATADEPFNFTDDGSAVAGGGAVGASGAAAALFRRSKDDMAVGFGRKRRPLEDAASCEVARSVSADGADAAKLKRRRASAPQMSPSYVLSGGSSGGAAGGVLKLPCVVGPDGVIYQLVPVGAAAAEAAYSSAAAALEPLREPEYYANRSLEERIQLLYGDLKSRLMTELGLPPSGKNNQEKNAELLGYHQHLCHHGDRRGLAHFAHHLNQLLRERQCRQAIRQESQKKAAAQRRKGEDGRFIKSDAATSDGRPAPARPPPATARG
mmetsp:Transcript_12404/g.37263  ORF Transcript_12404/g.37263 Transcript_12404/m.37263 type:complete len:465 (-) Transcript_12404:122-1516(-)